RRADGGHECRGEGRYVPLHPRRERGVRHHHRPHRARHGRGHGYLRPRGRAGIRPQDRRRHARRGARRSEGDRCVSGRESLMDVLFFFKVLIGGLLSGVMYSLVALGYVLIFKASGVFNFAQGAMVLFAALTFVSLVEKMGSTAPGDLIFWVAMLITLV